MKKFLLAVVLTLGVAGFAKAEEPTEGGPKLLANFGAVKVYVPLTSINVVNMWELVGKTGLVGGETPFGSLNTGKVQFEFTAGAVTSLGGEGTPFVGLNFGVTNPAESWIPLSSINPGIFAGRDFNADAWMYGIKASINIFG